jgi:DNA-binding LytR/AlgR family response regulator
MSGQMTERLKTPNHGPTARAVVADDERLLREQLIAALAEVWPQLEIVAQARHGQEAIECVTRFRPDVVFLDIRMPGISGVEAAAQIVQLDLGEDRQPPEIVFVTAFDQYAVQAFERGAVDYVLKPAQPERLRLTAARLQQRLGQEPRAVHPHLQALLQELRAQTGAHGGAAPNMLRWIQAGVGSTIQMIPIEEVLFFISDEKYTRVQTATMAGLIRTSIRELVDTLDPQAFWQIHRSTVVRVGSIEGVYRDARARQLVRVRGWPEPLEVSRSFGGLFKAM